VCVEMVSLFPVLSCIGRRWLAVLGCVLALVVRGSVATAQTAQFSYAIAALGDTSGDHYISAPAIDSSGNIYVASVTSNSTVQKIPAGCRFSSCMTTLGGGFQDPYGVAVDGSGNIYVADTSNNAVKETPSGCASSICVVTLGGGFQSPHGVAVDGSGNIYIADTYNSAVKEMPAGCASSICVVTLGGGFQDPYSVAVDGSGNVYVADFYNNAIKEVPAGCASSSCVTTLGGGFNRPQGVALDSSGNIYVTDTYNNLLKEMPAGCVSSGCVTTLAGGFSEPSGVVADISSNVYVSDFSHRLVVEVMARGANFFTVPVGQNTTETLTFTFTAGGTIGAPLVLMQGAPNLDFTDLGTGSCTTNGTSYSYNPGDTCTVDVQFAPQYPGTRHGAANLVDSLGGVIASAYLYGTGTGPQVIYPSNHYDPVISALGSGGFGQPWGVALDGIGNVYVADRGGDEVKVMSSGCANSTCVATLGGGFNTPVGIAVDGGGNIYVADEGSSAVKKMPAGCTSSGCVTTLGGGFSRPTGVAADNIGNVYVTDFDSPAVKEVPLGCTSAACVKTLGDGFNFPYGLAVDDNGNVFVADTFNNVVKKVPPGCTSSTCVVTMGGGPSSQVYGVAVDGMGDVYFIDNTPNGEEKRMPPDCVSAACVTQLGNDGVSVGLAVDASHNVYFADRGFGVVRVLSQNTPPMLSFASTAVGSTSSDSPQTVVIENSGNAPLSFPVPSAGGNPSIATNFSFTASCPAPTNLPVSSSGTVEILAAGAQCALSVSFSPTAAGNINGSLVLTDDHLNAASPDYSNQTINLRGTATAVVPDAPTNVTAIAGDREATVSFTPPAFDGGSAIVSYTVTSAPGNISVTCNSSPCTIPGLSNGTSYTFTVTAKNSAGTSGPSSPSNPVTPKAPQTITFNSPGSQVFGTTPTLTATASSTLPVTFTSATPAVCTITSGGTLTFVSRGTCTIDADQAGSNAYSAAAQVSRSFTVSGGTMTPLSPGGLLRRSRMVRSSPPLN
jgi:large repetitive protein